MFTLKKDVSIDCKSVLPESVLAVYVINSQTSQFIKNTDSS